MPGGVCPIVAFSGDICYILFMLQKGELGCEGREQNDDIDHRGFSHGENAAGAKASRKVPIPLLVHRPFENGVNPKQEHNLNAL